MDRSTLVTYLDDFLNIAEITDYGPQGLQVETGNKEIERVALAVDTAPAVIREAGNWGADLLLAHHGILWRSVEAIAGPLGLRVRMLMDKGINLYAAHLALDAHPEVGNNIVLAQLLDVAVKGWWCAPTGTTIAVYGRVKGSMTLDDFVDRVEEKLHATTRVLAYGPARVKNVAIVSGFGADKAAEAKALGADTLLTGETSHANYWAAADYDLNVVYAGHYATETVGVQALGHHLADEFGLEIRFFDFPTSM